MNCKYILNGTEFNSYQELLNYIVTNIKKYEKDLGNLQDVIYSLDEITDAAQIEEALRNIKEDNQDIKIDFNIKDGQVVDSVEGDYTPVSDYVDRAKIDGEPFVTPYDIDDYKKKLGIKFQNQGISESEIEAKVQEQLEKERNLGRYSIVMHKAVRAYFSGAKTKEALKTVLEEDLEKYPISDASLKKLVQGLERFESELISKYGDYRTVSGINLTAKVTDSKKPIAASIDLAVIDKEGNIHIYLVNGSGKPFKTLSQERLIRKDYELAFRRHMLASYGINVSNTTLNYIPILISSETEIEDLDVESSVDRTSTVFGDQINPLTWRYGKYYYNVNEKISLDLPTVHTTTSLENLKDHMDKFFPKLSIHTAIFEDDVDTFIKEKIIDSDNPEKGRYMYRNPATHKKEYIKTSRVKDLSEEVRKFVEAKVAGQQGLSNLVYNNFITQLKDVLKGAKDPAELISFGSPQVQSRILVNLAPYINSGWKIVEAREDFKAAGIIILENTSGTLNFIALRNETLNSPLKLSLGSTLLGAHVKDEHSLHISNLMKSTFGNITMMEIMDLINSSYKDFGNKTIGTLQVLNLRDATSTIASREELITSYSRLCRKTDVENNLNKIVFATNIDIFKHYLLASVNKEIFNRLTVTKIFADLENVNPDISESVLEILYRIKLMMEKNYSAKLNRPVEELVKYYDDEVITLYAELCRTILFYEGIPFTLSKELSKFSGTLKDEMLFNGTLISNPSTIPEANIQKIVELTRTAMRHMTDEIMDDFEPFRNNEVQKLWDAKGYTSFQNITLGNQRHLYINMFQTNSDGSLNGELLLKNPYTDKSLKPEEKQFLISWLERMNALRYDTEEELLTAKADGSWLKIPLIEASLASKTEGIRDPIKFALKEASSLLEYMKNSFKRDEDGVYDKLEEEMMIDYQNRYKIFNRLEASYNPSKRLELLSKHDINFWETNLELLYALSLYAKKRKQNLDKVLPVIKALRLIGLMYGEQTGVKMHEFDNYLQLYMKSHIHNLSILSDEEKRVMGTVTPTFKFLASTLTMGFSLNTGVRNLLESVWKVPARIATKFYAPGECFTKEEWGRAMEMMAGDTMDFAQKVTLIEAINQRFRIQDMDANRIAEKIASYKSGLTHTKERLMFWFSVAPDYFNRMSMVIAQMIHDGTWEACSFSDNGFEYDWKKDKRFSRYAKGLDDGSKEYLQLRALYLFLLRTYNEEHKTNEQEGFQIPLPYTSALINALKDFSDSVFGFYDHDLRAMIERGAIASLFTQFKTYLTASRTVWFLAPGAYNKGETEQMIDEVTGKPMFLKMVKKSDGTEYMVPTIEDTGIPWILARQSYMEGIFFSLKHIWDDIKTLGIKQAYRNTKESAIRRNNLWFMLILLLIASFFSMMLVALLKAYKKHAKERDNVERKTVATVIQDSVVINGLKNLTSSFQDANIFRAVTDLTLDAEPAAFSIATNFFTSTEDFLFGNKSLESWLHTNSGAYRSGEEIYKGIKTLTTT